MRKSLLLAALTIGLMAAVVVSIFTVFRDPESGQVTAAAVQPPAAQVEGAVSLQTVGESADASWESVSVTSVSDRYSRGDGSGVSADHDGELCPFKATKLRDNEL